MAKKGWILEEISNSSLKFVRSESKSLKYLVYIINKVSSLGNKDNTKESDYKNYYKEAGWTFVCESDKIQIYSSEFYNMKIDTNENEIEKFNTISKTSFKSVFSKLILATFLLLPQYLGTIGQKNIYFLADPLKLGSFMVIFILFISEILNLITFLLFFIKGKLAIKNESKVQYKIQNSVAFKKLINRITSFSMIIIFLSFGINFYYNYYKRNINEFTLKLEDFNDMNKDDSNYLRVDKSPIAKYIYYSNAGEKYI